MDVLIGSDFYWDFITGESIRGDSGPTAVKSKFGWLLSGPTQTSHSETNVYVVSNLVILGETFLNEHRESDKMVDMLKSFWEVESLGIVDPEGEDELVERKTNIEFNGQHYEVGQPWKEGCFPQSNNYGMCATRLRSLHSKLKKEPKLLKEYHNIIQDQRKNGIVEILPASKDEDFKETNRNTEVTSKGIHYSPHHAVVRRDRETTKVQVVYDGSAKNCKDERSLNDCL